jgi:hypothetical protein
MHCYGSANTATQCNQSYSLGQFDLRISAVYSVGRARLLLSSPECICFRCALFHHKSNEKHTEPQSTSSTVLISQDQVLSSLLILCRGICVILFYSHTDLPHSCRSAQQVPRFYVEDRTAASEKHILRFRLTDNYQNTSTSKPHSFTPPTLTGKSTFIILYPS